MIPTETIDFIYLECFSGPIYQANAGSCASNRAFGELCTRVLCRENVISLTAISSDRWFHRTKDPMAHIFSVLWLGKVILRDSKTNSFSNVSYGRQEEVVVVTASFITPKTHVANLGVIFFLYSPVCFQWLSRPRTSAAGTNQRDAHMILPRYHAERSHEIASTHAKQCNACRQTVQFTWLFVRKYSSQNTFICPLQHDFREVGWRERSEHLRSF